MYGSRTMSENYFGEIDSDIIGQIKLPSFITFNCASSQQSLGDCNSDDLFLNGNINQYHQDLIKTDEEDSRTQCSVPSNSTISTPDMMPNLHPSNKRSGNISCTQSIYQSESWLNVGFTTPNSFFYKDADKPSKAVTVMHLPNHNYAVLYVGRGRTIEVTAETNFIIPSNSFLKFDTYTWKGTNEEPVYGDSSGNQAASNLCFIQSVDDKNNSAFYMKSEDGFIFMLVPFVSSPLSFSVVFPFLNFKCPTASKKIVLLRISVINGTSILASRMFQLVSCTSPNRDLKRHFDKYNCNPSKPKVPSKKEKTKNDCEKNPHCGTLNIAQPINNKIDENPQYVIMTENYEIWKILNIVHKQLKEYFDSSKK